MAAKDRLLFKDKEVKETHFKPLLVFTKHPLYIFIFFLSWFLFLFYWLPAKTNVTSSSVAQKKNGQNPMMKRTCDLGAQVYMYELPEKFNSGLLRDCRSLSVYTDMCPHVENRGLGRPLPEMGSPSWYATHQFIAEMIFHARVENHPCRTWDPAGAQLFYVPFYGGLHVSSHFREPDLSVRDRLAVELAEYLSQQPTWQAHQGGDHFLALGRTAWDFMRSNDGPDFGANTLLKLPRVLNMSVLTVERNPWHGSNQFGIPYASYFHPSTWDEMLTWQNKMRESPRPHLFTFVGATRTGVEKAEVRNAIDRETVRRVDSVPPAAVRAWGERVPRPGPGPERDEPVKLLHAAAWRLVHSAVRVRLGPGRVHPGLLLAPHGLHSVPVVPPGRPGRVLGLPCGGEVGADRGGAGEDSGGEGSENAGHGN